MKMMAHVHAVGVMLLVVFAMSAFTLWFLFVQAIEMAIQKVLVRKRAKDFTERSNHV